MSRHLPVGSEFGPFGKAMDAVYEVMKDRIGTARPQVTRTGMLDMQVCVPTEYTDAQAEEFANAANPSGTEHGWRMRKADDPAQAGAPLRVKCRDRDGFIHIMLSC
jgi:hypothetical protein